MISSIYFDQETRTFGLKELPGKAWSSIKKNERGVIGGASAALGATAGALIARKNAIKKAEEAGLEKGTAEYKKAVRGAALKGAALGGVAGGAASELGHIGVRSLKKGEDGKRAGLKATLGQMYVDPAKKAWSATGGKIFKRKESKAE